MLVEVSASRKLGRRLGLQLREVQPRSRRPGRSSASRRRCARDNGAIAEARIGLTNMGSTPVRRARRSSRPWPAPATPDAISRAAAAGRGRHQPARATSTRTADYRQHLARVLTGRAVPRPPGGSTDPASGPAGPAARRGCSDPAGHAGRAGAAPATSPTTGWRRRPTSRWRCQRPLFLEGEAGVGKTALAHAPGARRSAPSCSGCSATRASTPRRRSTTGTSRASCCTCGPPRPAGGARWRGASSRPRSTAGASCWPGRCSRRWRPRPRCCSSTRSTAPTTSSRRSCSRCSSRLHASRSPSSAPCAPRCRRSSSSPPTAPARCTTPSSAAASTTGWSTRTSTARSRSCARRVPEATAALAEQVAARGRTRCAREDLLKPPGVAETIDWTAGAGRARRRAARTPSVATATLGAVLKYREDQDARHAGSDVAQAAGSTAVRGAGRDAHAAYDAVRQPASGSAAHAAARAGVAASRRAGCTPAVPALSSARRRAGARRRLLGGPADAVRDARRPAPATTARSRAYFGDRPGAVARRQRPRRATCGWSPSRRRSAATTEARRGRRPDRARRGAPARRAAAPPRRRRADAGRAGRARAGCWRRCALPGERAHDPPARGRRPRGRRRPARAPLRALLRGRRRAGPAAPPAPRPRARGGSVLLVDVSGSMERLRRRAAALRPRRAARRGAAARRCSASAPG